MCFKAGDVTNDHIRNLMTRNTVVLFLKAVVTGKFKTDTDFGSDNIYLTLKAVIQLEINKDQNRSL